MFKMILNYIQLVENHYYLIGIFETKHYVQIILKGIITAKTCRFLLLDGNT